MRLIFLIRRGTTLVLTALVSSFLIFGAMYLAPGSPLDFLLGGTDVSKPELAALKHQYALDRPFAVRYFSWLDQILHGHLGTSIIYQAPVSQLIAARLGTTMLLIAYALVITVVVGLLWGAVGAIRRGWVDSAVVASTSTALATPPFVVAVLLIGVFALRLKWFPVVGGGSSSFGDQLWHLTLPAVSLSAALSAFLARIVRTSFIEELRSEHVLTAMGRGLSKRTIVRRHVARNALLPITTIVGLIVAYLITGTIVVEGVFGLNGIGSLLVSSVEAHDFPVVQAICLIVVVAFLLVNLLVDLAYFAIDPRIRLRQ